MANKQHEVSESTETESNLRVIRLMTRVENLKEELTVGENKNIIAFVGPTKAGKSTLINCLLGTKLKCYMDKSRQKTCIIKADELSFGPKIGGGCESETESPECWGNMSDTEYKMWDFAGFYDNKGTEQEIVNAISYQTILLAQNSVRFVLVVPFYMIDSDDLLPFYKLLNELNTICPEIADSLCIVFSKFKEGDVKKWLKRANSEDFKKTEKDNLDIINRGKHIIKKILENNNYFDFKVPEMKEEEEDKIFILPNKQLFIYCISKLRGTKVKDFPLVISDKAKLVISELYTVFYQRVKKEVENMNTLIEKYIQYKIDEILEAKGEDGKPTSAASRFANFKRGKNTLEEIKENSKDFKSFFAEISKLGISNKEISAVFEKFTFTEKMKNMYKMNNTELSSRREIEFSLNVKLVLNIGITKYSDLIIMSTTAAEEEKRKEKELEKLHNDKVNNLKNEIKNLKRDNDSVQVALDEKLQEMANEHNQKVQELQEKITDLSSKKCVILLANDINYKNPLLNTSLLLKSFSDLYGTKALSYLISLTEVLSEDSSESLQEICGSPHALEMFATMIGLS